MVATNFSKTENEVIFLLTITDIIDSMVNFEMLQLVGGPTDAYIMFHSTTHQKFFNVLLVDLLSKPDEKLVGRNVAFIDALTDICNNPCFNIGTSIGSLQVALESFSEWLSFEPTVDVWLPSADSNLQLTLPRSTFIDICGNVSKHSILRRSRTAEKLRNLCEKAGVSLSLDGALLALENFYERFHTDIFNYHSSQIVVFLNEIQWGIYEYLALREDLAGAPVLLTSFERARLG